MRAVVLLLFSLAVSNLPDWLATRVVIPDGSFKNVIIYCDSLKTIRLCALPSFISQVGQSDRDINFEVIGESSKCFFVETITDYYNGHFGPEIRGWVDKSDCYLFVHPDRDDTVWLYDAPGGEKKDLIRFKSRHDTDLIVHPVSFGEGRWTLVRIDIDGEDFCGWTENATYYIWGI